MVPRTIAPKVRPRNGDAFTCPLKGKTSFSHQNLQRLIAHWYTGSHSKSVSDFHNIWNRHKIDHFSDQTPPFNMTLLEQEVPIENLLVFMNGKLHKYSSMRLQPWFDLRRPGYIVSQLGETVNPGYEKVVLLQSRKRTDDETLLSASFGNKRYPLQMIQRHLDQCSRELDLGKTSKLFGLFSKNSYSIQDVVIPERLWTAYIKAGLKGSRLDCGKANLSSFSIEDVIEAFRDSQSHSVLNFANLPVINLYMVKVPDYIFDELII